MIELELINHFNVGYVVLHCGVSPSLIASESTYALLFFLTYTESLSTS